VLSGEIGVYSTKDKHPIKVFKEGELFGHLSLFLECEKMYSSAAITNSVLISIDKSDFDEVMSHHNYARSLIKLNAYKVARNMGVAPTIA